MGSLSIHSRYLVAAVMGRLAIALPALCALALAFDLGDQGRRLAATLGWQPVLMGALLHVPLTLVQVMPVALLLSSALALAALRRRGELDAMRCAGLSPRRLWGPVLLCGLACCGAALLLDEGLVPASERAADRAYRNLRLSPLTGAMPGSGWLRLGPWMVERQGRSGDRVLAVELDRDFRPLRRLSAGLAGLHLKDVRLLEFGPAGRASQRRSLPWLGRALGIWEVARVRPEALGALDLLRRLELQRAAGQEQAMDRIILHTKLAYPLINLVAALLACTLAGPALRTRSPIIEPLRALGLILGLWFLLAAGWMLGRSGWLSPPVAAWLPLALAAAPAGVSLALQSRTSQ